MTSDLIRSTFALGHATEFGRSLIEPGGFFEVAEEDVLGSRHAVFKNRMRAVHEILATSAAGNPDREYLLDETRRLTYAEAADAVARFAALLRDEHGVRPGDLVGIHAANSVEWVLAFWAISRVGGVVTAMNSYWSDPETSYAVELTEPVLVLADAKRAETLARTAPGTPVALLDDALWTRISGGPVPAEEPAAIDEDAPALVMFTSGTTGRPKGVVHRHRTVIGLFHCAMYNALLRMGDFPSEIPPPPRVLVGPPFFHLSALYGSIVMYTASNGTLVLRPGRFDEVRTLRAIQDEKVTYWLSVGSSAPRVASHPDLGKYDLSSLSMVMVGGAPMTPTVRALLRKAFPNGEDSVRMGYTSTEAGTSITTIGGDEFVAHPDSTGPVQDGLLVEIRDTDGRPVPDGTDGGVFVRSPYLMLGYHRDPEATDAVLGVDSWLSMGDVGRLESGELYLNSRARDLIFVSSENVYPSEVENRLEEHPAVLECCVAGIDDPITGQAVAAFVVLGPGVSTSSTTGEVATTGEVELVETLAEHCRGGLPPYKVPTSWHLRTEPLPRNATGKVQRTQLVAALDGATA